MKVLLDNAKVIAPQTWIADAPPHAIATFTGPKLRKGRRSILLVDDAWVEAGGSLCFDVSVATLLNLGTTSEVLIIGCDAAGPDEGHEKTEVGPGDREFLALVQSELKGEASEAAKYILRSIRTKHPGDLKRGKRHNFSETPDNFWYVIVQPRAQSLSITVRGAPTRFQPSTLEVKADRPGYSRFKVGTLQEANEALRIIELSNA